MVDFHTHILPGMDDGARDAAESRKMLELLSRQGVTAVCLTPHFYPYKESLESFLNRREESFAKIRPLSGELGVRFALASETFFNDYLFHSEDISRLCMKDDGGRGYLLTELPFGTSFSERTLDRLSRLMNTYSVYPVLAHIERYPNLVNHRRLIGRLIDMGCLMQINLSAFQKGFLLKRRLLGDIRGNLVHVVGTDAHNLQHRPPAYQDGISLIRKSLGDDAVDRLSRNAGKMISGCLLGEEKKNDEEENEP